MKKNIKMIVTDLDGTLLREDKTVSERTIAGFQRCRELGIKIVYATGRSGHSENLPGIFSTNMFDGRIVNNGAIAEAEGMVVYDRQILFNIARPFLVACEKEGLKVASQSKGMHYSNFPVSDVWPFIKNYEVVDFNTHDKDSEKIYCVQCDKDAEKFIREHLPEELYLTVARDLLGQIMHKEATKSKALVVLAGYLGINKSEIVAFGDDLNDIDMLELAGTSVAMENALEEVKKAADEICPGNEEDGIAIWLEQWVLKEENV